MDLDKKFRKVLEMKKSSYGRMVQLQKRLFDEWALEKFAENGYPHFKIGYLPFLMNIGEHGITNQQLSLMAGVTKQAMSKVLKELQAYELVKYVPQEDDARKNILTLTKKGKEMVIHCYETVQKKTREYEKMVGKKALDEAVATMYKIIAYEQEARSAKKKKPVVYRK